MGGACQNTGMNLGAEGSKGEIPRALKIGVVELEEAKEKQIAVDSLKREKSRFLARTNVRETSSKRTWFLMVQIPQITLQARMRHSFLDEGDKELMRGPMKRC
jgi:hypothetical protein